MQLADIEFTIQGRVLATSVSSELKIKTRTKQKEDYNVIVTDLTALCITAVYLDCKATQINSNVGWLVYTTTRSLCSLITGMTSSCKKKCILHSSKCTQHLYTVFEKYVVQYVHSGSEIIINLLL